MFCLIFLSHLCITSWTPPPPQLINVHTHCATYVNTVEEINIYNILKTCTSASKDMDKYIMIVTQDLFKAQRNNSSKGTHTSDRNRNRKGKKNKEEVLSTVGAYID